MRCERQSWNLRHRKSESKIGKLLLVWNLLRYINRLAREARMARRVEMNLRRALPHRVEAKMALLITLCVAFLASSSMTEEQTVGAVFRQVSPLVVVRTTEKDFGLEGDGLHVKAIPGLGSGVLVSSGGKVITAAHVVQTADEIFVQFLGGEVAKGRVIASEPEADVALVQLERQPPRAAAAKLGDSDKAQAGDQVFIVGAP